MTILLEVGSKCSEAANYFRGEPGFNRLFSILIEAYKNRSKMPNTIKLGELNPDENKILPVFFGRYYSTNKNGEFHFKIVTFEKALNQEGSRFAGVDVFELLTKYHGGPILTNADKELSYKTRKRAFFEEIFSSWRHVEAQKIKGYILEPCLGSNVFHKWYDEDDKMLAQYLKTAFKAIDSLPCVTNHHQYLPLFAAQITGNPHAFDMHTSLGKVVLSLLSLMIDEKCRKRSGEELTAFLEQFGIWRDDLLNHVICSGLLAYDPKTLQPLPSWQGCNYERSAKIVTLRELLKSIQVKVPSSVKKVFVVENSGVFSALLDRLEEEELPPMICTAGQCRLAALLLIDSLIENDDAILYYSGDFDPEGLLIAQKLIERHPKHVVPWRLGRDEYLRCVSSQVMEEARMRKLQGVSVPDLLSAKEIIWKSRKAGYQEKLLDLLELDIREHLRK